MLSKLFLSVLLVQLTSQTLFAEEVKTLTIDKANSKVAFIADAVFVDGKLGYTVEGVFSDYDGKIQLAPQFEDSKIQLKIKIDSVKTKTIKVDNKLDGVSGAVGGGAMNALAAMDSLRDTHLKSADYFDAANFNEATFRSIGISTNKDGYILKGKLTIHGISQTGDFNLKPVKQYQDVQNKKHTVFEAKTSFNRNDFGVGVTAGQVTVMGHTIKIKDDVALNILLDTVEAAP